MGKYRRVSSYKIMNDYKRTAINLKYIAKMANAKDRRFFRINNATIEKNIVASKMTNNEKTFLLRLINEKDFHKIFCYADMLRKTYYKKYIGYKKRMDELFMSIEDKSIFYA